MRFLSPSQAAEPASRVTGRTCGGALCQAVPAASPNEFSDVYDPTGTIPIEITCKGSRWAGA